MQGCPSEMFGNDPVTLSEGLHTLVSEHLPLRDSLNELYSLCEKIKKGESDAFQQLIGDVDRFSSQLERHSKREEDILFRMMEEYLGKNGGPIAVMEYEHEQAHRYINDFVKNTTSDNQLTIEMQNHNASLIENAYHTLLNHFSKEEQVLYPMAERLFSDEEKQQLLAQITK
ncbi:hemerythrin domain-containing protein [Bacillus rubiinfantis]|uniref:hemerythrin domain-containing protein n=1 Tax=Bacillus rubiinfantis TaxID=1499680 RepID=UPI0005A93AAF|nr:hemerythrin domain-containing protein [Bacillus rubiinfantis]